ncbi:MAG: hypothetical protein K0S99_2064 [Thermomicrobiales bacterium]|nr:hypothetical protein [Thermomicrobiales bacterium]
MAESRIASLCAHASGETAWRGKGNGSIRTALVAKMERSTAARSGGDLSASISMVGLVPSHRLQAPARRFGKRYIMIRMAVMPKMTQSQIGIPF